MFWLDNGHLKEYSNMITPRCDATAAGHEDVLIIAGGKGDGNETFGSIELFNSTTRQQFGTGHLPLPHSELQSEIIDNTPYFLGGYDAKYCSSLAVFVASLYLNTFPLKCHSHQSTPLNYSCPVSLFRNLLVIGGRKPNSPQVSDDIHLFDDVNHSRKVVVQLPFAKCGASAVAISEDKILVIGGYNGNEYTNTVWIGATDPTINVLCCTLSIRY